MDPALEKQQQLYDRTWARGLAAGKQHRSNFTVNLAFLDGLDCFAPGTRVLELGCGTGAVLAHLAAKGCRCLGTDISTEAVRFGRQAYPDLDLRAEPAETLSFADASFDFVLSFDVLEHLRRVDDHLAEVVRVLRPGGAYLLETPNKLLSAPFETLRARSLRWKQFHPSLHTASGLRRRLAAHGLACEFVKMNTMTPFALQKLGRLAPLFKRLNLARLPLCLQSNFYVIARKPAAEAAA